MKSPNTTLHIIPFREVCSNLKDLKKGDWVLLPSGSVVQVFGFQNAWKPKHDYPGGTNTGDMEMVCVPEVVTREVSEEGENSNVSVFFSRAWVMKYGRAV